MALTLHSSEKFAQHIEHRVQKFHLTYMEAILEFCEVRELDPEAVVPLLSDKIRAAIATEAQQRRLLPRANSLPL